MSKILNILLLVAMLAFLGYFFVFKTTKTKGDLAPDIEAELIDGSLFELKQLRGNYVLLDFWASWCGPCIREAPNLVELNNTYTGLDYSDADGFEILSVALERNDKTWKRAIERLRFNWKYQIVDIIRFVRMSKVASDYGVTEIPSKFLIGPSGQILMTDPSFEELSQFLESKRI